MGLGKEKYVARRAAREAGRIMQKMRERNMDFSVKEDSSIVTEADRRCQEKIVEIISEEFPDDGFMGEEDGLSPGDEERVWVIDPVDGTTNYYHGYPFYCTSIGLRVGGSYRMGVVFSPVFGNMFTGESEGKALLDGKNISVSDTELLRNSLVSYSPGGKHLSEGDELYEREQKFTERLETAGVSMRDAGSGALGLVHVAAGWADAFISSFTYEWDFAGALPVVEAAGGEVMVRESDFGDGMYEVVAMAPGISEKIREKYRSSFPLEM